MSYLGNPLSTVDFPVDYFTGDGTSTTFQLSRIPASATSILVHIGGVKQVASTTDPAYYLDGSKLVFVSPPGAYSPIEVNYLGIAGQVNIPGVQSVTQDMLSLQLANTFVYQTTANGATASFTLNAPPVSANSLVVSANGVVQYDYSVNGTNLTFGFTPPVGTFIRVTSLALAQAGVPADGSVTSVKLGANLTITGNTTFDGFAGSPARIRGDMTTTTFANRLAFQTSTTNGTSSMTLLPNGSGVNAFYRSYGNSDPTNASEMAVGVVGTSEVRLQSGITGSGTYVPITMYTGGSERLRIDTSGRVGIGTSSPQSYVNLAGLAVVGPVSNTQFFAGSTSGGVSIGSYPGGVYLQTTSSNDFIAGTVSSNDLILRTNGTERMRIDSSGNVLVGNSTDVLGTNKLYVQSASTSNNNRTFSVYNTTATSTTAFANRLVQISSNGSGADATLHFSDQALYNAYIGMGSGALYFATGGTTERMRIDASGNVGIGTTGPAAKLHVNGTYGTTATGGVRLTGLGNTTGDLSPIAFYLQSSGWGTQHQATITAQQVSGTDGGANLLFSTSTTGQFSPTERMRITSDGNVGIGTSSPSTRLTVGRVDTSNEGGQIDLCRASDNASAWAVDVFGSTSTPSFRIVDNVAASARMVIDSSGNVGIGTSSPRGKLEVDPGTNSSFVVLHANRPSAGTTSSLNAQLFTISIPYSNGGAGIGGTMRVFVNASAESGLNACANRSAIFDIVISRTGANSGGGNTDVDVQIAELTNASSSIGAPVISDIGLTASNPAASASAQTVDINITGASNGTYIWRIYATIQYMGWETITFSNLTP